LSTLLSSRDRKALTAEASVTECRRLACFFATRLLTSLRSKWRRNGRFESSSLHRAPSFRPRSHRNTSNRSPSSAWDHVVRLTDNRRPSLTRCPRDVLARAPSPPTRVGNSGAEQNRILCGLRYPNRRANETAIVCLLPNRLICWALCWAASFTDDRRPPPPPPPHAAVARRALCSPRPRAPGGGVPRGASCRGGRRRRRRRRRRPQCPHRRHAAGCIPRGRAGGGTARPCRRGGGGRCRRRAAAAAAAAVAAAAAAAVAVPPNGAGRVGWAGWHAGGRPRR